MGALLSAVEQESAAQHEKADICRIHSTVRKKKVGIENRFCTFASSSSVGLLVRVERHHSTLYLLVLVALAFRIQYSTVMREREMCAVATSNPYSTVPYLSNSSRAQADAEPSRRMDEQLS